MRYALIHDDVVENVVLWDGSSAWTVPEGLAAVPCPDAVGPGWRLEGDVWVPPPEAAANFPT